MFLSGRSVFTCTCHQLLLLSLSRCWLCCAARPAHWVQLWPASVRPRPPRLSGRCCSPRPGRAPGPLGSSACARGLRGGPASCDLADPAPVAAAGCTQKVSSAVRGRFRVGCGTEAGKPRPRVGCLELLLEVHNIFPVTGNLWVIPPCHPVSLSPTSLKHFVLG